MRAPFPGRQVGAAVAGWGKGGSGVSGGSCQALRWEDRSQGTGEQGWGCSTERTQNPNSVDMSLSELQELVMDREAWLQFMGSQRVGHDCATCN